MPIRLMTKKTKNQNKITDTLSKLIAIDSVSAQGTAKPAKALHFMLDTAQKMDLITQNVDNVAGHVQLGAGGCLCGVLTHLDVVGAAEGWSVNPFELTKKNGRLYGRGISDDKAAAVIALY